MTSIGTGTLRGNLLRGMFYPLHVMFDFDNQMWWAFFCMCCLQPLTFIVMMVVINPLQNAVTLQTFVPVVAT